MGTMALPSKGGRPKSRRRLVVAVSTALVILSFSALQLVDHLYLLKSLLYVPSASFVESLPPIVATTMSSNFTFWTPPDRAPATQQENSSPLSIERQVATPQGLPLRNISRNLCGSILKASPTAMRFPRILSSSSPSSTSKTCSPNAIFYMVQKGKHSSYKRNSTALFLRSLDKLYEHYLSVDRHYENVDVLVVHSGDYHQDDLNFLQDRYNHTVHFKLVDLSHTDYWTLPETVQNDNIRQWAVYPEFSVGYRHMIRWYGLKLYDFARDYAERSDGCRYEYLMRMDEDSFLHSPIQYDLFDFMQSHNYSYAFRMCSFEMEMTVWEEFVDHHQYCGVPLASEVPYRQLEEGLCGFYNNFFIISTEFVLQPDVQYFLQWIDATGLMYRERYNDLQIQTIAVYAFLPPERIHRFLDWTYEHVTVSRRCPVFGAIQAGYLDPDPDRSFAAFRKDYGTCGLLRDKGLRDKGTSPTYSHLPPTEWFEKTFGLPRRKYRFKTLGVGSVEDPRVKGLSG